MTAKIQRRLLFQHSCMTQCVHRSHESQDVCVPAFATNLPESSLRLWVDHRRPYGTALGRHTAAQMDPLQASRIAMIRSWKSKQRGSQKTGEPQPTGGQAVNPRIVGYMDTQSVWPLANYFGYDVQFLLPTCFIFVMRNHFIGSESFKLAEGDKLTSELCSKFTNLSKQ